VCAGTCFEAISASYFVMYSYCVIRSEDEKQIEQHQNGDIESLSKKIHIHIRLRDSYRPMGALHNVVLAVRSVGKMFIPTVKDQRRLYQELLAVAAAVKHATQDPGWP